ncbi:CheD [Pirellula staleyi DSM 6068]|uniref:Probable chemoreceptor glutamine deamidase CheD n=1 Tax=Pirellula staleyi (strain ATCC 27377 / DSM 6068 / ICPB 4128) TaxID=530564 RepID=D2QXD5_PIRSD|nr:chemotaxis protein CheD [Pirellula staleyi]ADB17975.1 CheD [Pirellula staleyi DSM 6068]
MLLAEAAPTTGQTHSVGMGQIVLTQAPHTLNSVLGSCVGVALHHPRYEVAILAHVVLPNSQGKAGTPGKFADTAIPELLQQLARAGVPAAGIVARIAGGSNMFGAATGPMQIGEHNIAAVEEALAKARIRIIGKHVGGSKGRRVIVHPTNGNLIVEVVGQPLTTL